jgi:DNA-binding NarL/FixJ family response regulator
VLLVDDHLMVRSGLAALINAQPDLQVVGEADDGQEAFHLACELLPDIIVMDMSLPGWNGTQATARIKHHLPHVKVVALSMHEDQGRLRSLVEAGASGYVLKRSAAEVLISAICTVARGSAYFDPHLSPMTVQAITWNTSSKGKFPGDGDGMQGALLTDRQEEILKLIAQGYTDKEIGVTLFLNIKTVETYKARAMEKLELDSRADLVRYALARGWLRQVERHVEREN